MSNEKKQQQSQSDSDFYLSIFKQVDKKRKGEMTTEQNGKQTDTAATKWRN